MDIYQSVTDRIVAAIEANPNDYQMPWHRSKGQLPENPHTNAHYRGVNVVQLWSEQMLRGYNSVYWATYKQWTELGAQVRKGEKSALVVFYKSYKVEDEEEERRVLKWSYAFNADQVDGWKPPEVTLLPPIEKIDRLEAFVAGTGITVKEGGSRAFYSHANDTVQMPDSQRFYGKRRTENWYSVLMHELTHATGHRSRLDRHLGNRFGSEAYAAEELIAELGAAFLCAKLSITPEVREDHAQYINNWLNALKRDKKYIFSASARAQEAVQYLIPA